jgi:hypothetical protein
MVSFEGKRRPCSLDVLHGGLEISIIAIFSQKTLLFQFFWSPKPWIRIQISYRIEPWQTLSMFENLHGVFRIRNSEFIDSGSGSSILG